MSLVFPLGFYHTNVNTSRLMMTFDRRWRDDVGVGCNRAEVPVRLGFPQEKSNHLYVFLKINCILF